MKAEKEIRFRNNLIAIYRAYYKKVSSQNIQVAYFQNDSRKPG